MAFLQYPKGFFNNTDFWKTKNKVPCGTLFDSTVMLKMSLFENLLTPEQQISLCIFYNDF